MEGMREKRQIYRRILVRDERLYPVSERLEGSLKDAKDSIGCIGTAQLYVLAPTMCLYVVWVLRSALASGKRRLYFLSRDGYSMYETAKVFCEKMALPIECRYLYCSRYAWRMAEYHLLKEESLSYICLGGIDVSFRKLMARAGLTEGEGEEIARMIGLKEGCEAPLSHRKLQELKDALAGCGPFMEKLLERSGRCYPLAAGYLRQEGLLDPVSWALVDSGWTGSLQKSLQHLLDAMGYKGRAEGYYFGMCEYPHGADPDTYHCWYFSPGRGLRRKVYFSNSLFECIFSSPEGMAVGYGRQEEGYCALLEKLWNPNWERVVWTTDCLRRYAQELSLTAGRDFLLEKGCDERDKKIAFLLLKAFMGRPDPQEALEFGNDVFCDDVIGEKDQKVAAKLTPEQIRGNRILQKIVSRMKRGGGVRESAWLEGSIVNCGMGAGELRRCALGKYILYLRKLAQHVLRRWKGCMCCIAESLRGML